MPGLTLQAAYWMTWFSLRGFTAIFEIAQLIGLIYVTVRKNLFGRTVRDIRSVAAEAAVS